MLFHPRKQEKRNEKKTKPVKYFRIFLVGYLRGNGNSDKKYLKELSRVAFEFIVGAAIFSTHEND